MKAATEKKAKNNEAKEKEAEEKEVKERRAQEKESKEKKAKEKAVKAWSRHQLSMRALHVFGVHRCQQLMLGCCVHCVHRHQETGMHFCEGVRAPVPTRRASSTGSPHPFIGPWVLGCRLIYDGKEGTLSSMLFVMCVCGGC